MCREHRYALPDRITRVLSWLVLASVLLGFAEKARSEDRTSFDIQFDRWIADLGHADLAVRQKAILSLRKLPNWRMTLARSSRLLRAAVHKYPPLDIDEQADESFVERYDVPTSDTGAALIYIVAERPRPEHIAIVLECFERYGNECRDQSMRLLAWLDSRESAEAAMQLVRMYARQGGLTQLYLWGWSETPEYARIFFPEILSYTADQPNLEDEIFGLLESYAEMPEHYAELLENCAPQLLAAYRRHEKAATRVLRTRSTIALHGKEYAPHREPMCQLLRLFFSCPTSEIREELLQALSYRDPQLKLAAASSLVRLHEPIARRVWEELAADRETRLSLFETLERLNRLHYFPTRYLSQAALAESDLTRWLAQHAEPPRPPVRIELMKVVSVDPQTDDGILDFYVFRYLLDAPREGKPVEWLAGVAGPYPRREQPTASSEYGPQSEFAPFDTKWPEEHIGNLSEIIQEYRWRAGFGG